MNISVLGCGWLGFPLAQRLSDIRFTVKGSTTTKSKLRLLKQNKIEPYLIDLPESFNDSSIENFWNCDLLFLNIPPRVRSNPGDKQYISTVEKIVETLSPAHNTWIMFTSATSVYSRTGGILTEEDAVPGKASRESGEVLLQAEKVLLNSGLDTTILRLGGLYGYGRHPIHYLSGKKQLPDAAKPVNLIHQLDCLNIIMEVIIQKKRNEVYNVVSDGHPPKKEFYRSAAEYFNLPLPHFAPEKDIDYSVISNEKVKKDLLYSFSYPNPMDHTP